MCKRILYVLVCALFAVAFGTTAQAQEKAEYSLTAAYTEISYQKREEGLVLRIDGAFAFSNPKCGQRMGEIQQGNLLFLCPKGKEEACRKQWDKWKADLPSHGCVTFGYANASARVRGCKDQSDPQTYDLEEYTRFVHYQDTCQELRQTQGYTTDHTKVSQEKKEEPTPHKDETQDLPLGQAPQSAPRVSQTPQTLPQTTPTPTQDQAKEQRNTQEPLTAGGQLGVGCSTTGQPHSPLRHLWMLALLGLLGLRKRQ